MKKNVNDSWKLIFIKKNMISLCECISNTYLNSRWSFPKQNGFRRREALLNILANLYDIWLSSRLLILSHVCVRLLSYYMSCREWQWKKANNVLVLLGGTFWPYRSLRNISGNPGRPRVTHWEVPLWSWPLSGATSHMWPLSTWNVADVHEKPNFPLVSF